MTKCTRTETMYMLSKNYKKKPQRDVSSEKDITQQTEKYKHGVSKNQWMNKNNIVDEHPYYSTSVLNHIPATAQHSMIKDICKEKLGIQISENDIYCSHPI